MTQDGAGSLCRDDKKTRLIQCMVSELMPQIQYEFMYKRGSKTRSIVKCMRNVRVYYNVCTLRLTNKRLASCQRVYNLTLT